MHFGDVIIILISIALSGAVVGGVLFGRKMLQLLSMRTDTQLVVEKAKRDQAKHAADVARHNQAIALATLQHETKQLETAGANPKSASAVKEATDAEETEEVSYGKSDIREPYFRSRDSVVDPSGVTYRDIEGADEAEFTPA